MLMRAVNPAGLNLKSLVDDVGEQVGGVRRASDEIAEGNSDLSARTERAASQLQQTAGIGQVNTAIAGLDQTTQQNADLVQHSSESAASLQTQAQRLADALAVFKSVPA